MISATNPETLVNGLGRLRSPEPTEAFTNDPTRLRDAHRENSFAPLAFFASFATGRVLRAPTALLFHLRFRSDQRVTSCSPCSGVSYAIFRQIWCIARCVVEHGDRVFTAVVIRRARRGNR